MTHVTCRLTAENRDQLRNLTLGNRVWATFTFDPYRGWSNSSCVRLVAGCSVAGDAVERGVGGGPTVRAVLRRAEEGQAHIPGADAARQAGLVRPAAALAATLGRRARVRRPAARHRHLHRSQLEFLAYPHPAGSSLLVAPEPE